MQDFDIWDRIYVTHVYGHHMPMALIKPARAISRGDKASLMKERKGGAVLD